jgi:hypothetical protein
MKKSKVSNVVDRTDFVEGYKRAYHRASQAGRTADDNHGERPPGSDGEHAAEVDAVALGKAKVGEAPRRK